MWTLVSGVAGAQQEHEEDVLTGPRAGSWPLGGGLPAALAPYGQAAALIHGRAGRQLWSRVGHAILPWPEVGPWTPH